MSLRLILPSAPILEYDSLIRAEMSWILFFLVSKIWMLTSIFSFKSYHIIIKKRHTFIPVIIHFYSLFTILLIYLCSTVISYHNYSYTPIFLYIPIKRIWTAWGKNSGSASFNSYFLLTLIRSEFHLRWENTNDGKNLMNNTPLQKDTAGIPEWEYKMVRSLPL